VICAVGPQGNLHGYREREGRWFLQIRQFNQASAQLAGTETRILLKKAVLCGGDSWQMVSDGNEAKER